jgi:hypothetical protein
MISHCVAVPLLLQPPELPPRDVARVPRPPAFFLPNILLCIFRRPRRSLFVAAGESFAFLAAI